MKVFISADMEGLATTSTWGDCDPANPAYQRHTQEMTDEVLAAWKKFFDNGTNWKDFAAGISYADYKAMTDKQHLSKAKSMPVKFLKASGKGFFIEKENYTLAIRDDLAEVIEKEAFQKHMKDILEYRTMEYYRRRYTGES